MTERVTFTSDGLKLAGILHLPSDRQPGRRCPAFLLLHGFGGNKDGVGVTGEAEYLASKGYAALRFDFRGCGDSEGEHGTVICLEQVADTRSAISFLQGRPEIDGARIALMGHSFGAAVAVYSGGVDERAAAVVSIGGWGNGERKFRAQHASPEAWDKFSAMLEEGGRRKARGERMMVPRFDIVPIPEHLRHNMAPGSILEFPWEVVRSMYDFRADDVVGKIAPRPLLLIHPAKDSVTPTRESVEMFLRANMPAELHLFVDLDHFLRADSDSRVTQLLEGWLARYFPA
jgi:uncharacterized protein